MSKLLMFDFECAACGHQFEDLVEPSAQESPCPSCRKQGKRLISPVRSDWRRMGCDPGFPGAAARWAKMQRHKSKVDKGGLADGAPTLKMY